MRLTTSSIHSLMVSAGPHPNPLVRAQKADVPRLLRSHTVSTFM